MGNEGVPEVPHSAESSGVGTSGVAGVAQNFGAEAQSLSEHLDLDALQESLHATALGLWKKGIGNMGFYSDGTLPITNCLGSAQVLGEQLQMGGYTPRYCYMYLEKGEQREPTDHVIPIVEIDDRIYMIDPHLKNTTLFALPEEGRDPVEIIFDANGVDGSGSGSHITTYTRLDKNRIRVERRNGSGDKVFQLRILDLNPRNDLEDLGNFFEAGRHVLKYEQYIRTIDGTEFNFMFRSDPKNDGSGEYVSKIVIGTTQYSESQFEEAKTELVQRMGENGNVLFDDLLSTRDTFIDSRKDTPEPTPAQIQQFSLTDSQ